MNLKNSNILIKFFKKNKYIFYLYLYIMWFKYNKEKKILSSKWYKPISNDISSGRIVNKSSKLISVFFNRNKEKLMQQKEDIYPLE